MNITKDYNLEEKNLNESDIESLKGIYLSLRSTEFKDIQIENYELIEQIGKGGFGVVFKAFSKIQKKHVALKFLDPETTAKEDSFKRVIREINNSQNINDKRLVVIYSIEKWEGIVFLVMKYYEGQTLKEFISNKENCKWEQFKPIFLEILDGVKVLHDNHIIHRDIKPSNIFITKDNQVVLLDFGLSKKLDEQTVSLTTDKILGTISFMSPEQLNPDKGIDYKSDIYQLGLILYMVIFGKLPYEGDTASIMTKKLYSSPEFPDLPDFKLPKYMKFGIEKSLERDAVNRFSSISEMIEYFEEEHYPLLGRTIQTIKKRPKTTVITVLLLLLITFLGYLFISNNDKIGKVEYNGSNLKVYNPFGIKLYERDFKDKKIQYATKQFLGFNSHNAIKQLNPQNSVIAFLEPENKKIYPNFQSNMENSHKINIIFIDKKNEYIDDINDNFNESRNLFYDFSKSFLFKLVEQIDVYNSEESMIVYIRRNYFGMFPTAIFFVYTDGRVSSYDNPGQFFYYKVNKKENNYKFLLYGINNIISHLTFLSETTLSKQQRYFIPNLSKHNYQNIKQFLVFLPYPIKIIKDKWFEKEGFIEFVDRNSKSIIKVSKKNEIMLKSKDKTLLFNDKKTDLNTIYENINRYYKEKMLRKNYKKGAFYIQSALKVGLENPWLKSALYYFLGDLKLREGNYKEGLLNLNKSLNLYSYNTDSFQRICELNFLTEKENELILLFKNNTTNRHLFFGLSDGLDIFKIYTYLHFGKFFKAEKIVNKITFAYFNSEASKNIVSGNPPLKAIQNIYSGDYEDAVLLSESLRGKNLSPFTLNEYRLIYSRAAILSSLFDKSPPKKIIMDLTRFYIEDISKNSITQNHLADISRAYFFAKDGEFAKARTLLNSGYKELLKMNKGDFFTRFWFFYDTFMYGKTMELLGNKEEAVKGYKASIKANPHTDLAKRAKKMIDKI